jgi:hypothetical protein
MWRTCNAYHDARGRDPILMFGVRRGRAAPCSRSVTVAAQTLDEGLNAHVLSQGRHSGSITSRLAHPLPVLSDSLEPQDSAAL